LTLLSSVLTFEPSSLEVTEMENRFNLLRPCPGCPFSRGPDAVRGLHAERLEQIVESDGGFACHRTTDYGEDEDGEELISGGQECAGYLIYHLVNESAPQMMRIAGRIGLIDTEALLKYEAETITDFYELVEVHTQRSPVCKP